MLPSLAVTVTVSSRRDSRASTVTAAAARRVRFSLSLRTVLKTPRSLEDELDMAFPFAHETARPAMAGRRHEFKYSNCSRCSHTTAQTSGHTARASFLAQ